MIKRLCVYASVLFCFMSLFTACTDPELTYKFKSQAPMKDGTTMVVEAKFIFKTDKGVEEIRKKDDRIRYALNLTMQKHESREFDYQGKARVTNVLRSITQQVLYEKVDQIKVIRFKCRKKKKT